MTGDRVVCPLCGFGFDPSAKAACQACPIAPGCGLTCCPACGYSWVEPGGSRLGRWLSKRLTAASPQAPPPRSAAVGGPARLSLADLPPRSRARVVDCRAVPRRRLLELRAFGLTDGGQVEVLGQVPATVIRLERTELAMEHDLAAKILVDTVRPSRGNGDSPAGRGDSRASDAGTPSGGLHSGGCWL